MFLLSKLWEDLFETGSDMKFFKNICIPEVAILESILNLIKMCRCENSRMKFNTFHSFKVWNSLEIILLKELERFIGDSRVRVSITSFHIYRKLATNIQTVLKIDHSDLKTVVNIEFVEVYISFLLMSQTKLCNTHYRILC